MNIFAEDELKTTVYEQEGLDSLDDYFKKILELNKSGNKEAVSSALSKLNQEEKEAFIDWAKADSDFPEMVKIMIKSSFNKLSFNINQEVYNKVCNCLMAAGLTVVQDPCFNEVESCDPNSVPFQVKFTDNNLITGGVDYTNKRVHLEARDAFDRFYDKSIDYITFEDLIESINHFQKDIAETYNEAKNTELSQDWTNILQDETFMKSIGAEDLVVKK